MMDSLQISEKGWPCERSTSTVAIMVATYTPAVKGSSGMSVFPLLARTRVPTSCTPCQAAQQTSRCRLRHARIQMLSVSNTTRWSAGTLHIKADSHDQSMQA